LNSQLDIIKIILSIRSVQITINQVKLQTKNTHFAPKMNRSSAAEELLESENRRRTEQLSDKVKLLKGLAIDIESETKEHNKFLNDMDDSFMSGLGLMHGGRTRLQRLISSGRGNRQLMCFVILALTSFFFFVYYVISRSFSDSS